MADIPSSEQKIQIEGTFDRAPTSQNLFQAIGGSINFLIDRINSLNLVVEDFTSSTTWTCPSGVTNVLLIACGGGGGGSASPAVVTNSPSYAICLGGGSAEVGFKELNVSPTFIYNVNLGAGGGQDAAGGDTTFVQASTTLATFHGGAGGTVKDGCPMFRTPKNGAGGVAGNNFSGTSLFGTTYFYGGDGGSFGGGGSASAGSGGSGASASGAGGGAGASAGGSGGSGRLLIVHL